MVPHQARSASKVEDSIYLVLRAGVTADCARPLRSPRDDRAPLGMGTRSVRRIVPTQSVGTSSKWLLTAIASLGPFEYNEILHGR